MWRCSKFWRRGRRGSHGGFIELERKIIVCAIRKIWGEKEGVREKATDVGCGEKIRTKLGAGGGDRVFVGKKKK